MTADADHLHHRFLRMRLKQYQVAIALYLINGVLVGIGLLSVVFKAQAVAIYIIGFMVGVYIIFRHLARVELRGESGGGCSGFAGTRPGVGFGGASR